MTTTAPQITRSKTSDSAQRSSSVPAAVEQEPMYDLMELFFFAYRDFVGDADRLLETYHFGRAHHRIIHFVTRQPGLTIAELLDILRITKQSLGRVLKDLLDQGYIESRAGVSDRRQRHLFPTPEGRRLALELARLQSQRFDRALHELPPNAREHALAFLTAVIDPQDREHVCGLVGVRDALWRKRPVP